MKSTLLALMVAAISCITGCGGLHVAPKLAQDAMHVEPTVVFMGDSITFNYGQSWASTAFSEHPTWTDAGVVGDDSGQMVDRFATAVVALHPAVVVILAGTNDVYPSWVFDGGLANWNTVQNIAYMVGVARAAGIQPILATIPPWGCPESNCALAEAKDGSQARYARIDALNSWIKAYGAQQGLIVIDYHSALVSVDGQTYVPDLTIDGVHPTPAGYDLMTPMVEDAITATESK